MTSPRTSYTFREGLTAMAAKAVGIDPDLAVAAGDSATGVIKLIRRAAKKKGADRAQAIGDAQQQLRRISPRQHPELVSALHAKLLALQGRGGDTEIAHVTPGEVVVPRTMQTPEVMRTLAAEAMRAGIDPRRYTVGHRANSVNPRTGAGEFLPTIEGPPYTYSPWSFGNWRPGLSGTGGGAGIDFVQYPDDGSAFAGAIHDQLATNLNAAINESRPARGGEVESGIRGWSKDELTAAKKWLEDRQFDADLGATAAATGLGLLGLTLMFPVAGVTLLAVNGLLYILGMGAVTFGGISLGIDHAIRLIDNELEKR